MEQMRLDKWLWAARFFKTRQLACEAINGGKVHLAGQRTKPGKEIRVGSRLSVHKNALEWELVVIGLARQRRPAREAAELYEESEQSRLRRQQLTDERRQLRVAGPAPHGRPSKKDRRDMERLLDKNR